MSGWTRLVGILLVVVGVIGLIYSGITYTREEVAVELGPVEIEARTRERIPIPPVVAAIALVGGTVLVMKSRRKTAR